MIIAISICYPYAYLFCMDCVGVNEFLMQACSKINVTMLNSNNFAQHEYVLKNVPQFAMSSLFYVSHCKTPPTSSLK